MRTPTAVVMAPALLLFLGACSGGVSLAEEEACNSIHAWEYGGRDDDNFDRAVVSAQEELADSDHDSLIAAADAITDGSESDRAAAVTEFLAECSDLGWEPPEG